MVVDSPPGRISASSPTRSRGRRTWTGLAPISWSARACSRTSPWSARMPTRGRGAALAAAVVGTGANCAIGPWLRLPAAGGQAFLRRDIGELQPAHRLAQAGTHLGQDLGVVPVGGGHHDRPRHALWVLAREDAASHEDRLRAELAHQAGVGRGGDSAGREVRHGELAHGGRLADDVEGCPELLGSCIQLVLAHAGQLADPLRDGAHVAHRFDDVAGPGLALGADHSPALADPAKGLAQVTATAHEGNAELVLVDVMLF